MKKQNLTFEEALAGLEKSASNLTKSDVTLEETLRNFEQGIEYYNECNKILENAKQKITVYERKFGGEDEK
jgi:exodeoxyribonuclease VII small subunit